MIDERLSESRETHDSLGPVSNKFNALEQILAT
jgi:hypothetical protein